jgi:hypothetical protein
MIALTIVVLAAAVADSRDRVRRDGLTDTATLRTWYDARYVRRGHEFGRESLERDLRAARNMRRWGPWLLSGGTVIAALVLTSVAASNVPGAAFSWASPLRILDAIPAEVLVETTIFFLLLPILVIEGILAALYVADFDISRLQRLLDSLN